MIFKLAWRNIWRNKRRTLITAASVFVAVILAIVMRSAQLGSYQHMIDNVVSYYTGYIQVHHKGYWNEQTLDNSFVPADSVYTIIKKSPSVTHFVPRLESFSLASAKELTKGAMVVGIEPQNENSLTGLKEKLIKGSYLVDSDNGVLIAQGLAQYLHLDVGDSMVMLGQGYQGMTANGIYRIKGIVKLPLPEMNKRMVYMTLYQAQQLFSANNRITSIAILLASGNDDDAVKQHLASAFKEQSYEVMDWKQMLPDLVGLIKVDNWGGIITIGVLYMVVTFGIFSTLLMMLAERTHEFGTLMALGMKRIKLIRVVTLEILMISGLGILAGIIIGWPIVTYFHLNPIHVSAQAAKGYEQFGIEPVFPFSNGWPIFIWQTLVVMGITLILSLYPGLRLAKLKTIDALKR